MDIILCEREDCVQIANKFCLNCKAMLCRSHRSDDIRDQQNKKTPEHFYIKVNEYQDNLDSFLGMYCENHPQNLLSCRCINCMKFSCKHCIVELCPKSAGRYHDTDEIADLAVSYRDEIQEVKNKVQQMSYTFLSAMKEACRQLERANADLDNMLMKVDEVVEIQITTIREEGKKLKGEIQEKMSSVIRQLADRTKALEEKEESSRRLLCDIHNCLNSSAATIMIVKNHSKLKEECKILLQSKMDDITASSFELILKGLNRSLELELKPKVSSPVACIDYAFPTEDSKAVLKLAQKWGAYGREYRTVVFVSKDKVMSIGYSSLQRLQFVEMIEERGSAYTNFYAWPIYQLLQNENSFLVISDRFDTGTFSISNADDVTSCQFKESHWYKSYKRMAITNNNQIVVLHRDSNSLLLISMETKEEELLKFNDGMMLTAYDLMTASDNNIILTCYDKDWRHLIVKYSLKTQQRVWLSDFLLPPQRDPFPIGIHVAGYQDDLYAITSKRPSKVLRLSLVTGYVVQEIQCQELPNYVQDVSMRGDTLAVAAQKEGIYLFRICNLN